MKVVIDAGHGGEDSGGTSLGQPEKRIALDYAVELARRVRERGHAVIMTRDADRFVALSERADIANRAAADLFVSIHANASDNRDARGPWTLYAAVSREGRRIAEVVHAAVHSVMGGNEDAAYPDASPWVGNRRLAVLRQTKMPAVLLELGFMTNPVEIKRLESPLVRSDVCRKVARAIERAMGHTPEVVAAEPPLVAETIPPNLERIIIPTRAHFEAAAEVRGYDPRSMSVMEWIEVAEAIFRIMQKTGVKVAKPAADMLAAILEEAA